jgi:tetratricopeptide (TPR) repeat protein
MKVKTKNVRPNFRIEHRASINAFYLFCFSFVSFCFLTSFVNAQIPLEQLGLTDFLIPYLEQPLQDVNTPTIQVQDAKFRTIRLEKPQTSDIEAVNFAADVNQELPQIGSDIPGNPTNNLIRQLWQAGICVYQGEKDNNSRNELRRLIEQVRSIEFKPPKQPESVINIEQAATTVEPNETPFEVDVTEGHEKKTIEYKLPYEPVTDRTLQMLGNIVQDPNQLDNPFKLAEVLFLSGRPKEAAMLYQEAFKSKSPDRTEAAQNRAWTLFQIGNCLRDDDPKTAQKAYRQLIAEYPESPWVDLAKVREKLIDWYQKEKPRMLIEECRL